MLQLTIVLVVLTLVLVYVVRHYVKAIRADLPTCSGCSASCCHPPDDACDRPDPPAANLR